MEFGLRFELSDNKFMQMKRMMVASLLCLIIVSCASSSRTDTIAPTYASIVSAKPTPTSIGIPNKFSVLEKRKVKFDNWGAYVILPENWDIDNPELAYDPGFDSESYLFWGHGLITKEGYLLQPEISFDFHRFRTDAEASTYLTDKLPDANELEYEFDKSYSPKEIGLNLDSAMVQKGKFADSPCYVIRAIHKDFGIEIRMFANFRIFPEVEQQFLEIIRSISVEN